MDNKKDKVFKNDSISCKLAEFKTINRKIIKLQSKCIILKHYYSNDIDENDPYFNIPLLLSNNIEGNEFIEDYITITSHLYDTIIMAIDLYNYNELIESEEFFPILMECMGNYMVLIFEYAELTKNIKKYRKNGYKVSIDIDEKTDEKIFGIMHSIISVIVNSPWIGVGDFKYLKNFIVTQN